MKNILTILSLTVLLQACMPEEDLPIQETNNIPDYFIECYCVPGKPFALCATKVLPISAALEIDFTTKMKIVIEAEKKYPLTWSVYTLEGSNLIYNYGNTACFQSIGTDSLHLSIRTPEGEKITASTPVPSPVNIYDSRIEENDVFIRFYTSRLSEENYYIYAAEAIRHDSVIGKSICYLDYSEERAPELVEKSLPLSAVREAEKIICTLKRITPANYEYQISLHAANTANQSSITTPVPLKGNLQGALGIFTCYTEDQAEIRCSELKKKKGK